MVQIRRAEAADEEALASIFAETSIRNSGYTSARLESSQNALDYYVRRSYLRCGPADSDGAWPLRKDLAAVTPNQGMEPTR